MSRDVNRYESIVFDKMADIWRDGRNAGMSDQKQAVESVLVLLDCIVDFRNPPESLAVEDGCGAMVKAVDA